MALQPTKIYVCFEPFQCFLDSKDSEFEMDENQRIRCVHQIAKALVHTARESVIHRAICPSNVVVRN